MKEKIIDRLVSVKSIVTLILTGVFSYLAIKGIVDGGQFVTIFTTIIAFYFGSQVEKRNQEEQSEEVPTPDAEFNDYE